MKNLRTIFSIAGAAGILAFYSCKKDTQTFNPSIESNPSGFALLSFYDGNEDLMKQNFSVNSSNFISIKGNQGTRIFIQANSFEDYSGNPISGNVQIELIEIMDRQSMVLTNKSTNGRLSNGDVSTLLTGGQVKLNATQGGRQLKFKSGSSYNASIPTANTGPMDPDMNKFTGFENIETNGIIWDDEDTTGVRIGQDTVGTTWGTTYTWTDSSFGWTNIDKFYSDPRPKTTIHVELPAGYDNFNTSVFIAYKGEPRALANFDVYDSSTELFTEHYGLIPIGLEVHFIIIAEINGQLKSSIISKTIVNNHLEVIPLLSNTTKTQLTTDIIGLP